MSPTSSTISLLSDAWDPRAHQQLPDQAPGSPGRARTPEPTREPPCGPALSSPPSPGCRDRSTQGQSQTPHGGLQGLRGGAPRGGEGGHLPRGRPGGSQAPYTSGEAPSYPGKGQGSSQPAQGYLYAGVGAFCYMGSTCTHPHLLPAAILGAVRNQSLDLAHHATGTLDTERRAQSYSENAGSRGRGRGRGRGGAGAGQEQCRGRSRALSQRGTKDSSGPAAEGAAPQTRLGPDLMTE